MSGYAYAFARAFRAWQDTQPQMVLTGWADMLDGLDERRTGTALLVEPVTGLPPSGTGSPEITWAVAAHPSRDERGDRQKGR